MKQRLIIIPIDDIMRLFRDYSYLVGFPEDAQCDTLLFNPQEMKMCLRVTADSLNGREKPENINFELKKTWLA